MATAKSFQDLLNQPENQQPAPAHGNAFVSPGMGPKRKTPPAYKQAPKRPNFSSAQRPGFSPPQRLATRASPKRQYTTFADRASLKVSLQQLPAGWGTWDIYQLLSPYGNLSRIEVFRRGPADNAYVIFRPPPEVTSWIFNGLLINTDGKQRRLEFCVIPQDDRKPALREGSPSITLPETIRLPMLHIEAGVMRAENEMASLFATEVSEDVSCELVVNTERKRIELFFSVPQMPKPRDGDPPTELIYKLSTDLSNVKRVRRQATHDGKTAVMIEMEMPPMLFRKTANVKATHDREVLSWNDYQAWYRQTSIDAHALDRSVTQLRSEAPILDAGRWLTYRALFGEDAASSTMFATLGRAFNENNVSVVSLSADSAVKVVAARSEELWQWAKGSSNPLSALRAMSGAVADIDFDGRYQLEVCLSLGVLHECNIDTEFLTRLAAMEPARAVKLLQKVADDKKRYYKPTDIFRLQHQVAVTAKKIPSYCATVPSAVITPSTIYFATPVVETSNRIMRKYELLANHFLRVKFTDERYKGRIMNGDDDTQTEVFTRVKRTMQNGIQIGDRHYEFLAFGNSQFRENGAYFFAPSGEINAAYIRARLGTFKKIRDVDRNVAKYASRLGQCFSTTRGMSVAVKVEKIDDVERDGACFTDGVGKMSPFLAQMIANELALPHANINPPSVFQFRLGGCKGVLAVDPAIKGATKCATVQIRPSQEKFPAPHHGLEICRYAQFTSAFLNVQIILVLSERGVKAGVFVKKMREALADIQKALTDQNTALEQLCKNIDYNRMTLAIADMIYDGFMEAQDPFLMSCLHLWRSWMIKYLKEKARIFVDQGAFVLGCTDETGSLRGHFDADATDGELSESTVLPEIFLQIPVDVKNGTYGVVEGICTLARNPSLHPGDIRVVRAVNVPALHHLRDCVVLPQTGDRDLANMCSGGDLDGDDFLVMWDRDLLPNEWYHAPMEYKGPQPVRSDGPVTVDNITSFFVIHMRSDNLARIATAHRYWADSRECPMGVKDPKCIELAHLHSMAVDYAKTGVAADFPKRLRIKQWPHWAEKQGKPFYISHKVLGQIYDEVQRVPFQPAWDLAFDERILGAFELDESIVQDAQEMKLVYDDAVRRIMAQYGIQSEFEVWTTFVLNHSNEEGDYKFAKKLYETVAALKQTHQELCYEKAGTTRQDRDWAKLSPFVAAMYTVTARQVTAAVAGSKETVMLGGQRVPVKPATFTSMPFMSFPWIFARELGYIAKRKTPGSPSGAQGYMAQPRRPAARKPQTDLLDGDVVLPSIQDISTAEGIVHEDDVLDVHHKDAGNAASDASPGTPLLPADSHIVQPSAHDVAAAGAQSALPGGGAEVQELFPVTSLRTATGIWNARAVNANTQTQPANNDEGEVAKAVGSSSRASCDEATEGEEVAGEEEEEEERVVLDDTRTTAFENLGKLLGFSASAV